MLDPPSIEEPPRRCFLAWVQFDGTNFCGYARQKEERTVADELDKAWLKWRGERISVRSSSRTDSGVHARRMPLWVQTGLKIPPRAVVHGWNSELPFDVAIQSAARVSEDFHIRHDAIGKRYVYRLWNARVRSPMRRKDHWLVTRPLDTDAMIRAAGDFVGTHDFSAFRASHCQALTARRHISKVDVQRDREFVSIVVEGNAFLHNMVRIIVGTLVEIGWGKIAPDSVPRIIASRQRDAAGQTAPALGLTLDDVFYGEHGARAGLQFKQSDGQTC